MPTWTPKPVWKDQDVFLIGGGTSLESFDWDQLKDELVIGCNDAFKLGYDVCDICLFGDGLKWFTEFKDQLVEYKGTVITNSIHLKDSRLDWLWYIERDAIGVSKDKLGWNFSTGACAVALAILLGAKRIFLLGYDMQLSKKGKSNWHPNYIDSPNPDSYGRFAKGFGSLKVSMTKECPDVEVINVTDDSRLDFYQKMPVDKFWVERSKRKS